MPAKLLTEFIGTFFLVLTIGLSVSQGPELAAFAPIAIGCALMIMVYMGGHISGGHYNPAVTLGVLIHGAIELAEAIPYWVVQIAGAIVAALVVSVILPATPEGGNYFGPYPGEAFSSWGAGPWLVEILFTFALVLVVLNTAVSSGTSGNSFYGLAIGFTVLTGAFAGGAISGGAFNPAVGIGPNLIKGTLGGNSEVFSAIPLHVVAPLIGGLLAAFVFKMQESFVESKANAK